MSFVAAQYRNTVVGTSSPVKLVVLLYDAAIRFLTQANMAAERGETLAVSDKLRRAQAIAVELHCSLDYDQSPELCRELDRLYEFVLHSIANAFLNPREHSLEPAINVMRELRAAWSDIAAKG